LVAKSTQTYKSMIHN